MNMTKKKSKRKTGSMAPKAGIGNHNKRGNGGAINTQKKST